MDNTEQETWRLTVDGRLAALEAAVAALTMLSGKKARKAVAAALERAADNPPPDQDPVYRAAMQEGLRSLAASLRVPDKPPSDA
jgi:hypothetical protein